MASAKLVWAKALREFLAEDFKPGDLITHEWFLDHFEMETPDELTRKAWCKFELKFLSYFMPMRETLLKEHFIDIQPAGNGCFTIIPPPDQTGHAMGQMATDYKRIHKRCSKRLKYVNRDGLTQQQVQENEDAQARVAQLKALAQPIWTK